MLYTWWCIFPVVVSERSLPLREQNFLLCEMVLREFHPSETNHSLFIMDPDSYVQVVSDPDPLSEKVTDTIRIRQ